MSQLFLKIPPKNSNNYPKVDISVSEGHPDSRSSSISTISPSNAAAQTQQQPSQSQQNSKHRHLEQSRRQFQMQQQLSLSTRIDDNSTLYGLVDELLKVSQANEAAKRDIWRQAREISEKSAEDDQHLQSPDIDVVPSGFRYREEYEASGVFDGYSGSAKERLELEVRQLTKMLDDRRRYNSDLLKTIGEYEDKLLEVMELMAARHVGRGRQVLEEMQEAGQTLGDKETQMYHEWNTLCAEEHKGIELYDPVAKVAEYIEKRM